MLFGDTKQQIPGPFSATIDARFPKATTHPCRPSSGQDAFWWRWGRFQHSNFHVRPGISAFPRWVKGSKGNILKTFAKHLGRRKPKIQLPKRQPKKIPNPPPKKKNKSHTRGALLKSFPSKNPRPSSKRLPTGPKMGPPVPRCQAPWSSGRRPSAAASPPSSGPKHWPGSCKSLDGQRSPWVRSNIK